MITYHGTSTIAAQTLVSGGVNVTFGGGELGRGFYTGEHLHEAKAWALHRSGDRQNNVVRFSPLDAEVESLTLKILDHSAAGLKRRWIKSGNQTRTFIFQVDMVWAPIVGSERASGDQYKWESKIAQDLLNDAKTPKVIV